MFGNQDDKKKGGAKMSADMRATGAARRERQLMSIRHRARDDNIKHLRAEEDAVDGNMANAGNSSEDVWAYNASTPPANVPLSLLPRFVQLVMQGQTQEEVLQGTLMIRKLLSVQKDPPYDAVTQSGVVPKVVELLDMSDFPQLQFEAAWALTNIAAGTTENTHLLVKCGCVPRFVALLHSPSADCRDQGAWAIGNLAGEGAACRDEALANNAMPGLLNLLANPQEEVHVMRNATWAVSNLCRGKPSPSLEQVQIALPMLAALLSHHDEQMVVDAAWGISYISDGQPERVQAVLEAGVLPRIVELLSAPTPNLITPAIRTIGNIATGLDEQTQMIINAGALPAMCSLLNHPKRSIRKETCWTVSNIAAGQSYQIDALVQANVFIPMMECLRAAELDVRKEAVWSVSNVATCGTVEHLQYLINVGVIPPLCDALRTYDQKIVIVALEALQCFLRVGQDSVESGAAESNVVEQQVMECGGVDYIEQLQNHTNADVYRLALLILETYFNTGEGIADGAVDGDINFENMGAAPQGGNAFQF